MTTRRHDSFSGWVRSRASLVLSLLVLCWPASSVLSDPPRDHVNIARPFGPGERLTYAISFLTMRAGTAVMAVEEAEPFDGRSALRLVSRATSNRTLSKIYPVDNYVESVIDAETLFPYHMTFHRREGRKKNDFDVSFRHAEGVVTSIKDGVGETLPIPPVTHDLISCLYYVRNLPSMEPGTSVMLNLHHDKKNYQVEVRVEGRERIHGGGRDVEAVRLLVIMPFQGLFLNEGNIRVWLTDDARRVPVLMKAKILIGSVVAKLIPSP